MGRLGRVHRFDTFFQIHWLLGLAAGTVLTIVGITGALMSFQQDILDLLNPATIAQLESETRRLSPPELVARYEKTHPTHSVVSLYWRNDRPYPFIVGYRTPATTGRHGPHVSLDPATGAKLGTPRGQWTFGLIRRLHERLAAGAIGQLVVGVSTLALVALSVTGLYIRWRRRPVRRWRWVWPRALGGKLAGEWHAVLGLWVLMAYLAASLTGLWWSFDWYRGGAKALFASHDATTRTRPVESKPTTLDFSRLWHHIDSVVAGARSISIRLPRADNPVVRIDYVPHNAAHIYARDSLEVSPARGTILERTRYADLGAGDKLLASVYALHMGAFFGWPGIVFMMTASLAMPVFFVTGCLLYIRRRRMKRTVAPAHVPALASADAARTLLVAYASQSGLAERVARHTATILGAAGHAIRLARIGELSPKRFDDYRRALFVVSTHGEGSAPVAARAFDRRLCAVGQPRLAHLDYALLALGDADYGDSFCAFGRRLDRALRARGARALITPIEVDKADIEALDRWHAALVGLFGATTDTAEPAFGRWRLAERATLNPDSRARPTVWLRLTNADGTPASWQAGDIAEIRPRQAACVVDAWLQRHSVDGTLPIAHYRQLMPLRHALADRQLPSRPAKPIADPQSWFDGLPALAARDYSIANVDRAHGIELVVRLAGSAKRSGVASGWLIEHAAIGAIVDIRLRANPGFRRPETAGYAPAIFIGNGTGIAGLRGHLQARIAEGQYENWLIFGERQRAADFYFEDEIQTWLATKALSYLDLAFSRDRDDGRYVQDRLVEHAERLRRWVERGAYLFICGGREGMAAAVTRVLTETLGRDTVTDLIDAERIRIDVY